MTAAKGIMENASQTATERPSGSPVIIYASRLMKGWEALQAVQSFKAQISSQETRQRIMRETEGSSLCLR
ncbi:hypothetical protein FHT67_001321 [Paenibacillus sp. BK720]|nr:hypothetical protein [Paenibacillus sp. BK720]